MEIEEAADLSIEVPPLPASPELQEMRAATPTRFGRAAASTIVRSRCYADGWVCGLMGALPMMAT
ncbi:hypothetical protein PR003_g1808 [Phytophthora rubi]|uniref:Uncharacterized protein n=1 Tax=Phytophthora rubi TaxID=129364 RepID=A0A6A3NXU3_9STRA|nr:hypothetical protein PR002_g1709 [Phytophthora rubi]KAE9357406.1 hypothetical protein PR003_g1808 [Phytophthora rubi]